MITPRPYKLGRKPRHFDPRIQKLSSVMPKLPTAPLSADWTKGIRSFGMMLNDQLGDCTCAGAFHARQIWTANTGIENTQPDSMVLKLYEAACGYNPNDPSSDQGGVEQNVLAYLMNHGFPLANGQVDKIVGYMEVNPQVLNEVKLTIYEFGLSYIGFQVPESIFDPETNMPLPVWELTDPNSQIEGGHAVILAGYDSHYATVVSWGQLYKMSWSFFQHYCEESYAIASKDWINSTGKTPLGLSLQQLESMMNGLRN